MTSQNDLNNFPLSSPPQPLPRQHSPDNHDTVIVIVFVSIGGVFFIALFIMAVFFCFLKKRKNKKKSVDETEIVHIDEHKKIKEAIVEDSHGKESIVVLSFEDDIHVDEAIKIKKDESFVELGFNDKSVQPNASTSSLH